MARITQEKVLQVAQELYEELGRKITRKELSSKLKCSFTAIDLQFKIDGVYVRDPLYKYVETPQEVRERHKFYKIGAYRVDPLRGYPKDHKEDVYTTPTKFVPRYLLEHFQRFAKSKRSRQMIRNSNN